MGGGQSRQAFRRDRRAGRQAGKQAFNVLGDLTAAPGPSQLGDHRWRFGARAAGRSRRIADAETAMQPSVGVEAWSRNMQENSAAATLLMAGLRFQSSSDHAICKVRRRARGVQNGRERQHDRPVIAAVAQSSHTSPDQGRIGQTARKKAVRDGHFRGDSMSSTGLSAPAGGSAVALAFAPDDASPGRARRQWEEVSRDKAATPAVKRGWGEQGWFEKGLATHECAALRGTAS